MGDSHSRILECRAEPCFAFAQRSVKAFALRQVVEMAHHAEPAVGHPQALNLPVVRFHYAQILAGSRCRGRVIGFASFKRMTKKIDCGSSERLFPNDSHHFGKIASNERLNPFEDFLGTASHQRKAKIRIDDVNAEGGTFDQIPKGRIGRFQR